MKLIVVIGMLSFLLVASVVGARLVLLSRRTRRTPERLVGLGLFSYASLGVPALVVAVPLSRVFGWGAWFGAIVMSHVALALTVAMLVFFVATVFRSGRRWALVVGWATVVVYVALGLAGLSIIADHEPGFAYPVAMRRIYGLSTSIWALVLGWTSIESFVFRERMKKRQALGLADPVLTNRFLVWGLGGLFASLDACVLAVLMSFGVSFTTSELPLFFLGVGGAAAAICWSLTFFSPQAYRRWVRARA